MQICNVKKLQVFAENKKQSCCGDIVLVYDWQFCKRLSSTINRI